MVVANTATISSADAKDFQVESGYRRSEKVSASSKSKEQDMRDMIFSQYIRPRLGNVSLMLPLWEIKRLGKWLWRSSLSFFPSLCPPHPPLLLSGGSHVWDRFYFRNELSKKFLLDSRPMRICACGLGLRPLMRDVLPMERRYRFYILFHFFSFTLFFSLRFRFVNGDVL